MRQEGLRHILLHWTVRLCPKGALSWLENPKFHRLSQNWAAFLTTRSARRRTRATRDTAYPATVTVDSKQLSERTITATEKSSFSWLD